MVMDGVRSLPRRSLKATATNPVLRYSPQKNWRLTTIEGAKARQYDAKNAQPPIQGGATTPLFRKKPRIRAG